MKNFTKTLNLGGISITVEVTDCTPVAPKRCACESTRYNYPTANVAHPCPPQPMREPDGFDAHIDRPKRENYCGWNATNEFLSDLSKYRKAEAAVKACDWPCREPMGNVQSAPCTPQPVKRTPQRDAWGRFTSSNPCSCNRTPQREVRQRSGLVPCGAVVTGHTSWGEPIFDR